MSMVREGGRTGELINGLNAAIRENPLAAGLIGAGVAWMLFGGTKGLGLAASAAKSAGGRAASMAATAGSAVASGVAGAGSRVADAAREATAAGSELTGSIASIVPDISAADTDKAYDAVTETGAALKDRLNSAAASGRAYGSVLQARLADGLERQPLLLGALGLAIGAGIASTFASTDMEEQFMGENGAAARESLQGLATEAQGRARQVLSDVSDEFQAQGLTPDAAKEVAAGIADKVKAVAGAARNSVADSFAKPEGFKPESFSKGPRG